MADMTSPRCPMPQQDPAERAQNFKEVALGYTPEMAIQEAIDCHERYVSALIIANACIAIMRQK